jgi:DNA repair protein RecN (Recombination protein N)
VLQFLNISNIALIDDLKVEFEVGLNLLTGETGSGKSIIVDALGLLIGERFNADLLKSGASRGSIEGLFQVDANPSFFELLDTAGIELEQTEPATKSNKSARKATELIIRREVSASGRNKIFINNQLATQTLLRDLRKYLVDIHGQGDQQTLFSHDTHLELLDSFAGTQDLLDELTTLFSDWSSLKRELAELTRNEAERFQLVDTLKFQLEELGRAELVVGEDEQLDEERRRLANVEKLTALSQSSYARIYEDDDAALTRLRQTANELNELAEFESGFREYLEGIESARALLEDLSFSLRDFADKLEFSPNRLAQIEDRLVELVRLKRKYGGSIESALEHQARSEDQLQKIETSDEREQHLAQQVADAYKRYATCATKLHRERVKAAKKFEQQVELGFKEVALENARFQVLITEREDRTADGPVPARKGLDKVEFYFSANVGEELKPLARVASGGEASRLMLVLKTVGNAMEFPRTIVFDEIDTGIGGRVTEAVGQRLKKLSQSNQVLCVTHQPQIARFADHHLMIHKETVKDRTRVVIAELDRNGRVEEIARMLTGSEITDNARRHARELLGKK